MPDADQYTPDTLRQIAWYQRAVIVCLLVQVLVWLVSVFGSLLTDDNWLDGIDWVMAVQISLGLVSGVFVFLLTRAVAGPVQGTFLGLLAVVPCVGLLVLLGANSRATGVLQATGVRVGLFGARTSDIEDTAWYADADEDEGW